MTKWPVLFRETPEGFTMYAPDLPELSVIGQTLEDAREQMRGAIAAHLREARERGEPTPRPTRIVEMVEVK